MDKSIITTFIAMFCVLGIGFLLGTGSIMIHINHHYSACVVERLMYANCYEKGGELYLEQYFRLDKNRTGYVSCGSVTNCETSPCKKDITFGKLYECHLQDKFYEINHSSAGMYTLLVCVALVALISLTVSLGLFRRYMGLLCFHSEYAALLINDKVEPRHS
jgi:hypothetical protein